MGKELFYISLVSLLIVISWIAFDAYHVLSTSTVTPVQEELIKPLTPEFDHEIILKVLERGIPPQ